MNATNNDLWETAEVAALFLVENVLPQRPSEENFRLMVKTIAAAIEAYLLARAGRNLEPSAN